MESWILNIFQAAILLKVRYCCGGFFVAVSLPGQIIIHDFCLHRTKQKSHKNITCWAQTGSQRCTPVCCQSSRYSSFFFSLIAGAKTRAYSSWVWSRGSGGLWLCSAGSVTGYSVRCGLLSTSPTYIVHGELNTPESLHCCLDCKKSSAANTLL